MISISLIGKDKDAEFFQQKPEKRLFLPNLQPGINSIKQIKIKNPSSD